MKFTLNGVIGVIGVVGVVGVVQRRDPTKIALKVTGNRKSEVLFLILASK